MAGIEDCFPGQSSSSLLVDGNSWLDPVADGDLASFSLISAKANPGVLGGHGGRPVFGILGSAARAFGVGTAVMDQFSWFLEPGGESGKPRGGIVTRRHGPAVVSWTGGRVGGTFP